MMPVDTATAGNKHHRCVVGARNGGDMNETPDLLWLSVTTLGVLGLGGMILYAMIRYRAWQGRRRHSRPTD